MAEDKKRERPKNAIKGYGFGGVDTVLSVDDVERDASQLALDSRPGRAKLVECYLILA